MSLESNHEREAIHLIAKALEAIMDTNYVFARELLRRAEKALDEANKP